MSSDLPDSLEDGSREAVYAEAWKFDSWYRRDTGYDGEAEAPQALLLWPYKLQPDLVKLPREYSTFISPMYVLVLRYYFGCPGSGYLHKSAYSWTCREFKDIILGKDNEETPLGPLMIVEGTLSGEGDSRQLLYGGFRIKSISLNVGFSDSKTL